MRYVYLIKNLVNGKVYVGQTKNFSNRKAGHLYEARRGGQRPLYRAIRKYGKENFTFEIIEECDESIVNEREQHWVAELDSFNPEKGYNLTSGGKQNTTLAESTKQRLHDLNCGEMNPMYGVHRFGTLCPFYGMKHTEESRRKISASSRGNKRWVGKHHREETKAKIGASNSIQQRGEKNSQFGTVWVSNFTLKKSQKIKLEELDSFIEQGWIKGRKMKW